MGNGVEYRDFEATWYCTFEVAMTRRVSGSGKDAEVERLRVCGGCGEIGMKSTDRWVEIRAA